MNISFVNYSVFRSALAFGFFVLAFGLAAQEVCDNGIDDDMDGLIDINDPDCDCNGIDVYFPSSLFPNPSFEEELCDPGPSAVDCAAGWMQPSDGTPDYIKDCQFVSVILPAPPCPIPDGNHCFGFLFSNLDQFIRREYVGTCLTSNLVPGTTYKLSFSIGFLGNTDDQFVSRPMDLTLFASTSCSSMPFPGFGCPTDAALPEPWEELTSVYVEGGFEWKQFSIEFTPTKDYAAVLIGPPCTDIGDINYYFLDNLVLAEKDAFSRDVIEVESGNACAGDLVLSIPEIENVDVQWYLDGVALIGQTNFTLQVQPGDVGQGVYTVMLSNAQGCTLTNPFNVAFDDPVLELFSSADGFCPGDVVQVWSNFLTGTFDWSTGSDINLAFVNQDGYTVLTYTNEFGCTSTDSIYIEGYDGIQFHLETFNESLPNANNGSITVVFDEPVQNPQFWWDGIPGSDTYDNLTAGEYCVSITADNKCPTVICDSILIDFYPLDVLISADSVRCEDDENGSVHINVIGGVPPVNILWSPEAGGGNQTDIFNLGPGEYSVTVTDDANTIVERSIVVGEPEILEVEVDQIDISCNGYGDGNLEIIDIQGGNGGYTWNWEDATEDVERRFLDPGTYELTLWDRKGCLYIEEFEIREPDPIEFTVMSIDETCEGAQDGEVEIFDISGGTPPYAVNWNGTPFGSTFLFENLSGESTYTIALSDANFCTEISQAEVEISTIFTVDIGPDTSVLRTHEVIVEASGSDTIAEYLWLRNDGEVFSCNFCSLVSARPDEGDILVTLQAKNEYGCVAIDQKLISIYEPYKAYFPTAVSPNNDGINDFFNVYNTDKINRIVSLSIYNRFGQKLFNAENVKPDPDIPLWDIRNGGLDHDPGVLTVIATVEFIDGMRSKYRGSLTIIR